MNINILEELLNISITLNKDSYDLMEHGVPYKLKFNMPPDSYIETKDQLGNILMYYNQNDLVVDTELDEQNIKEAIESFWFLNPTPEWTFGINKIMKPKEFTAILKQKYQYDEADLQYRVAKLTDYLNVKIKNADSEDDLDDNYYRVKEDLQDAKQRLIYVTKKLKEL